MKLAKEFIKFVAKELDLQSLPSNIKFVGNDYSANHLTFGTYNPETDEIVIVKENRHPADVLRTLAHELVHHKQREDDKGLDGEDGSDIENEANAVAGTLMRKFRYLHPEMFGEVFNVGPWGLHTNMEESVTRKVDAIHSAAKTNIPQKIEERYIDGYTAKLLITVMNKLSSQNKKQFMNESIDRMVAVAYKIMTN